MTSSHDAQTRPGSGPGTRAGFRTDVFPEIRRADAGAVLISEWDAGSRAGQRAVLDGVGRALRPQGQVRSYIDSLPGVEPLGFRRYVAPRGLVRG